MTPERVDDERRPLLGDAVKDKKHFNSVGLSASAFWILCISMWTAIFLSGFDGTIVATLLAPISSDFKAANKASWLGSSYALALCCVTPIYGRLCNIIGRRASILIAMITFGTGNLLRAVAPSMNILIFARCLTGFGGGGLQTVSSTIASDIVPLSHRGIMQGYSNVIGGFGAALGAPLGGFLADTVSWRWAFASQVPLCILAIIIVAINVRYPMPATARPISQTPWEAFKRIDFTGSILLGGWLSCALIAVSMKAESIDDDVKWTSPAILGLLIAAGTMFLLFVIVELRFAVEPVLPVEILRMRTPVAVAMTNFTIAICAVVAGYTLPLFYQAVKQKSAAQAGTYVIPSSFVWMISSIAAGYYVQMFGRTYWLIMFTGTLGIGSFVLFSTWDTETPEWMFWTNYMLFTISGGFVTTLIIVALIAAIDKEHIAMATSLQYEARMIGAVLGISMQGALMQTVLQKELSQRITGEGSQQIIRKLRQSSELIRTLPPALRAAAIASWQKAIQAVFVMGIVLSVAYVICAAFIEDVDVKAASARDAEERAASEELSARADA